MYRLVQGELYKVGESDSQKVIKDWVPFAEVAMDRYFGRISNSEFCSRVTQEVALSLAGGAVVNKAVKSAGRVVKAVAGKVAKKESGGGKVLIHTQPKGVTKTSTKKQQKNLNVGSNEASISKVAVKQEKSSAEIVANRNIEVQKTKTATSSQIANDVLPSNIQKNVLDKRAGDAINKAPYNPRNMESLLNSRYNGSNVTSSTMPKPNAKNVKLAGSGRTFVVGTDEVTGKPIVKHIPFNERGMPIFDDVSVCDLKLPQDIAKIQNRDLHFKKATVELKKLIESKQVSKSLFSDEQLKSIFAESIRIPGFTWHHHESIGRMQLVPRKIHQTIGHFGGFDLWYK